MFSITVKVTDKKAFDTFVKEMICSCPETTKFVISKNTISITDPNDSSWINTNRAKMLLECGEIVDVDIRITTINEDIVSEAVSGEETTDFTVIDSILRESTNFHDVSVNLYKTFNIISRKNVGVDRLSSLLEQFEGSTIKAAQIRKHLSNAVANRLFKAAKEHGVDLVAVINYILSNSNMMRSSSDDSPSEDTTEAD